MALAIDIVAAKPNPHTIETTRTPSRKSVPKRPVESVTTLSEHTMRVSTAMKATATAIPCTSEGAFGRLTSASTRNRMLRGPNPGSKRSPAKRLPDGHAEPRCRDQTGLDRQTVVGLGGLDDITDIVPLEHRPCVPTEVGSASYWTSGLANAPRRTMSPW